MAPSPTTADKESAAQLFHHNRGASPSDNGQLSEEHWRTLVEGSAISPDVLPESEAHTITRGRDLPEGFSERQRRRAPGTLFPVPRPNGETSWCFRPDRADPDRPGHKYEMPCKALGGAGNVLGILPSQRHLIADTTKTVIFVEGTKKQLSVISALRKAGIYDVLVVAIVGVWNWLHNGGEPISDLGDIPLGDRAATIAFDSDVLTNSQVQDAARRFADYLGERGAQVHMTFFEHKPDGSKCGADDFFAAGGTIPQLRLLTRRYNPDDFVKVRLSRDERLRAMLDDLVARYDAMPAAKPSECSDRATMRELVRSAETSGQPVLGNPSGLVVRAPSRTLANRTHMTQQAQVKSLRRLAQAGFLERIEEPPRKVEAQGAAYLLYAERTERALRCHYGTREAQTNGSQEECADTEPRRNANSYAGDNATRASSGVPELRHSKVVHTWARRNGRRVVVDSEYVYRLAKQRQEILMFLLDNDGAAHEDALLERFGSKSMRLRDFRRRKIAPLLGWRYSRDKETGAERKLETGPPLVERDERGVVRILPEWREALEEHRRTTGEHEDNARQEERYRRQSRSYRNRDRTPAGEEGPLMGKEKVARLVEERRREEKERWIEDQQRKVGETAATFLADTLAGITGIRFKELRQRWAERGGRGVEDLRCAVLYGPYLFKREVVDGELYVYHEDRLRGGAG